MTSIPREPVELAECRELLPCPHCGPGGSCVEYYQDDYGYHKVGCGRCGSHSGTRPKSDPTGKATVIALWNKRIPARSPHEAAKGVDEKLHNMMLAHLDGVYSINARKDADEVISEIIGLALRPHPQPAAVPVEVIRELRRIHRKMLEVATIKNGELGYEVNQLGKRLNCAVAALSALPPSSGEWVEVSERDFAETVRTVPLNVSSSRRGGENGLRNTDEVFAALKTAGIQLMRRGL